MRIYIALCILRHFCRVMRVGIPDFATDASPSYKLRILLTRATLSINGYSPCVLSDGMRGWSKGQARGTAKYALEQIHAGMPHQV